uniref:Reverse transcriptase/retrotransposon-derived protein RNase H-like domain-containing protein n=1 Tax=Fagus sylvatica TaxID=28930 RepID=A0A2N9J3C0_FAGSY
MKGTSGTKQGYQVEVHEECSVCHDPEHPTKDCPMLPSVVGVFEEHCGAIGNFRKPFSPYSETYNPGWRNHFNWLRMTLTLPNNHLCHKGVSPNPIPPNMHLHHNNSLPLMFMELNCWKPRFEELPKSENKALPSSVAIPKLELKQLPSGLKYAFLESGDTFPIVISSVLNMDQEGKVLARCEEKNLVLNWEKFHFMVTFGIVLGHIVSSRGIEVDKSKDAPFIWMEACQEAFAKLIDKLTSAPIMRSPDWSLPFELMCDASDYAIGAVKFRSSGAHKIREIFWLSFQSMMEERLPKPAEMNHQPQAGRNVNHAPSSIRVQPSFGEQLPTTPPSIHRLPIGAKERNALSMRAPNHEEQTMVQPEPQREAQLGQGGGAPIVGKQPSIFEPIEPIPTRAESRNVRPMRAPNHEVHFNPNQPRFGMPYDDPFEPRRKRLNGGQCGLYGEEYWHEKRLPRQQGQQGQQAQPQRHASQAREPRNAPWPQGDVVEPWYDHGGGKGNWGRARNYQGPQDRDPYGKNQDPLQRQQGRQAREPRAMKLEFPRFKGGDPTSWMFRAIQYFEYYQVHDASKVMHASYHLDDDALIWFKSCEHDLGCWDNFARAIQLRGCLSHLAIGIRNLSSMHKLNCFMSGLKDEVRLAIKMQGPRTLGEAYALAKIQEQYLANVKRSTRPSCEANKDNWEQHSSQQVAAQFGPKVAAQIVPKVAAQIDPKVAECDPKVAAQIVPKVGAQIDPKVAECDPKVAAQIVPKVAAQIDPKVAECDPKVANGQVIRTLGECKEVKFKMQGLHLKLTFNLLELGGYGIVLGKKVWLQGLKDKPNLIEGSKDFKGKATMKGLLLQIMPCELVSIQEVICVPIRELVEESPQILEEPEGLPPKRNHEDQILLKHETSKLAGLLQPLGIPPRPWHSISMDFAKLGETITPISRLPPTDALGHLAPQPARILETPTIKKRRLPVVTKVLVQWEGEDPDDATWKLLFKLQEDYPHLVGKVF